MARLDSEYVNSEYVKVDTHSHTCFSGDSTTTLSEFVDAGQKSGLDYIAVTDHSKIEGALKLKTIEDKLPFRVIIGQEQKVPEGELIGLFLTERIPAGLGLLKTAESIKDQGGLVIVPHPIDPFRHSLKANHIQQLLEHGYLDAIESFNSKTRSDSVTKDVTQLAKRIKVCVTAGSDSHVPEALGSSYLVMEKFTTPQDFIQNLKTASIVGTYFDPPRQWKPRLVNYELEDLKTQLNKASDEKN
jgi:predicted metal-dependent phosphoesterase TrpH